MSSLRVASEGLFHRPSERISLQPDFGDNGCDPWKVIRRMNAMIKEPQIKAALIDGLFEQNMVDANTVIVSEMPVFGMARRADLVLANGRLIGFEIKSNSDTIDRLQGQISAYSSFFEGVVVICGSKHVEKVLAFTPQAVGVFVVEENEGSLGVAKPLRKPHIRNMDRETAIRQMTARDLLKTARAAGVSQISSKDRSTLENIARTLDTKVLRSAALNAIKQRYSAQFAAFMTAKGQNAATLDALPLLRRPAWRTHLVGSPERLQINHTDDSSISLAEICVKPRLV